MLVTKRLYIRELIHEDAERLAEYRDKPEVYKYQSWNHYSYQKARNRINYCLEHPFLGGIGNYQLAVTLKEEDFLIGDYFIEVRNKQEVTLGYTFDNEYWSLGYASESLDAMLTMLKEQYGFKSVICHVYQENSRSIRLLEKHGFIEYDRSFIFGDASYQKTL